MQSIHTYIHIYIHTYTHTYTHIHMHTYTRTHSHIRTHTCAHTRARTHAHKHAHARARTHTHARTYIHIYNIIPYYTIDVAYFWSGKIDLKIDSIQTNLLYGTIKTNFENFIKFYHLIVPAPGHDSVYKCAELYSENYTIKIIYLL